MSNAQGMPGGEGGMLKLLFDRYISQLDCWIVDGKGMFADFVFVVGYLMVTFDTYYYYVDFS